MAEEKKEEEVVVRRCIGGGGRGAGERDVGGRGGVGSRTGRRVKKGGSARESERSIRTLATFFVVGTGNRGRRRERDRGAGSYVCALVTQRGMAKEGDKARE